jgi:plastocyanin
VTPPTQTTNLGTELRYSVILSSTNFTGAVELAATGIPASWTSAFSPSSTVNVPLDGQATVELVLTVPPDGEAMTAPISIDATAAPGARSATTSATVNNDLVLEWGLGTGGGNHGFPNNLTIRLGTTLHIKNGDMTAHRVHSDGGAGFPHQDNSIGQGQEYVVVPGDVGGYRFYCHDHGDGTGVTNLSVQ